MIDAIIVLIVESLIIIALVSVAAVMIWRNSRLEREKKFDRLELESALAGKEALKEQNGRLQQELHYAHLELAQVKGQNADLSEAPEKTRLLYNKLLKEHKELEARSTALSEALEAKPTLPAKRVRKPQTTGETR